MDSEPGALSSAAPDAGANHDVISGAVVTPMGNPGSATHVFGEKGSFGIQASRTNDVATNWLMVESFTPTATGFRVRFNHAFDPSSLSIYAGPGNAQGPADVLLFDQGVAQIDSVVVDEDFTGLRSCVKVQSGSPATSTSARR